MRFLAMATGTKPRVRKRGKAGAYIAPAGVQRCARGRLKAVVPGDCDDGVEEEEGVEAGAPVAATMMEDGGDRGGEDGWWQRFKGVLA